MGSMRAHILALTLASSTLSAQTPSAFARVSLPESPVDTQMARRASTGGYYVVSVEKSEPSALEAVVRERITGNRGYLVGEIAPGNELEAIQSALIPMPQGITPDSFKIDRATRVRVIHDAIGKLDADYVFPDVARKMADAVRSRLEHGDYDTVTNGVTFASLLTRHLRAVSHDLHLTVTFSPARLSDADVNGRRTQPGHFTERERCGFMKVEHREDNVGYLKLNSFARTDACAAIASAAMSSLADVDALIVDLRDNGGGMPAMVAYVSSYLFTTRTHLNDLWTRRTNRTEEFWTHDVPGKKLRDGTPVYLLTSARTFSGAEEFAYDLKSLKRATIVGETTGGGAHPVFTQRITDHFLIGVPYARAINPITKTNWEGTGVEPDVRVPAAEALSVASKMIAIRRGPASGPGRRQPWLH